MREQRETVIREDGAVVREEPTTVVREEPTTVVRESRPSTVVAHRDNFLGPVLAVIGIVALLALVIWFFANGPAGSPDVSNEPETRIDNRDTGGEGGTTDTAPRGEADSGTGAGTDTGADSGTDAGTDAGAETGADAQTGAGVESTP